MKIHRELPAGSILVFLTGKKEIIYLVKRLKIELRKEVIESEEEGDTKVQTGEGPQNVLVLPLYSQLSPEQ